MLGHVCKLTRDPREVSPADARAVLPGSDGDLADTNVTSNVADLVNAADHLRHHHGDS